MTRACIITAFFCAIASAAPVLITTTSLPNGRVGTSYNHALAASGGKKPFTWTISAGALPDGLDLDSATGAIAGTPTTVGASTFTAKVTDSDGGSDTQTLRITVDPAPLSVTTSSLPGGTVGQTYSASLQATGGTGGYTWTISAGSLPAGLTVSVAGVIGGTPTASGTANFTAQVRDSSNTTASKALSIAVTAPPLTITTSSLTGGTVGVAYSQSLSATGGAGGNTWTVSAGSLPAGLTMTPDGTVRGAPTAPGTSNFTAQVKDSANTTATKPLTIAIAAPTLTVTTASLPNATAGAAYSQSLSASGGSGGNTWSIAAGSLPAGLTLSAAGAITGTPNAAGSSNFTAQVKDSANATASKALTLTVNPPALTVTTTTLAPATLLTPYSQTLTASGGAGGNTWTLTSGALPPGLSLGQDGTIAGSPLLPGTANFTVQVRDSANATASKALTLVVTATPVVISTQSLPPAEQGVPYSQTLAATGGTGTYRWTLSDGALPTGLTLDPGGRISGTPTGATSTFTVQAADPSGATATKSFTLTVTPAPTFASPATLASGALGANYSATVTVSGGQPPFTFALASGQLPPGLTLNTGTGDISGRPSQVGTFTFTLQARDAAGGQTSSGFTITIAAGLTITTAPVLPAAAVALPYQATLAAAGGASPYTWSAIAGSLPAGVTLHSDGKIDGTPTTAGTFTFTAAVTDANGARATRDFSLTVAAGLTITTAPQLPSAVPGAPYSATLAAAGGRPPYTWSISAGSLPAGVTLNSSSGVVSGTPSIVGTYNFTASVTDSASVTAQKAFTLTVAPGLTFTTAAALPDAIAGTPYSFTLQASGGRTPYSWRITDGALPDGLALNAVSGAIGGTPAITGTFNFTVEVSDATGLKGARVHTLVSSLPGFPTLAVTGVPSSLAALQQPTLDVTISAPYPVAISGRLNLAFVPASGMPDDPSVQFSTGGRSVPFTIVANSTRATFSSPQLAVQSGSVAGTLRFTIDSLQAGSAPVPAPGAPVATAQVTAAAALIRRLTVTRTSSGFDLQVVGLSDTRELTAATVRFRPTSGASLGTAEVTVQLADAAKSWFQAAGSTPYGGQFTLTLPFTFNGSVPLDSVSVILTNTVGASTEVAAPY
jgi:large repetitive protein